MKELADRMWNEAKMIRANALRMTWHMRGGVSYEEIMNMSRDELESINKLIEENMETTKKTQLPFF